MGKIAFCVPPYANYVNSSLRIAKELRNREHEVSFWGLAGWDNGIKSEGFEFVPLFEPYFLNDQKRKMTGPESDSLFNRVRLWRGRFKNLKEFFRSLIEYGAPDFEEKVQKYQPQLFVIMVPSFLHHSFLCSLLAYAS